MNTPDLLTAMETCSRRGHWSRDWESNRLTPTELLQLALRAAMLETTRTDLGELAGETVMELAHDRGLNTKTHEVYESACHHAVLSDVLTHAISRKDGPWRVPDTLVRPNYVWNSGAFIDPSGAFLRRFVLCSHWSDERHYQEIYSWRTWGEICQYELPMQQIVFILGPHRDGRRHSAWTKALLHPRSGKMRFRKKGQSATTKFKETYKPIWREDHAEIPVTDWIQAMVEDDVMRDVMLRIDIPVPEKSEVERTREMTGRKLEELWNKTNTPDKNLSTCWSHDQCCPFYGCCYGIPQTPSVKAGFLRLESLFQFPTDVSAFASKQS